MTWPFIYRQYGDVNGCADVAVLATLVDLESEYERFVEEAKPKMDDFNRTKYARKATEQRQTDPARAKMMIEKFESLNWRYYLFLKDIYSLDFPRKVVEYLKEKGVQEPVSVISEDEFSLLDTMKKGWPWNDILFTGITGEKPKDTIRCIRLFEVKDQGVKAKVELIEWSILKPELLQVLDW